MSDLFASGSASAPSDSYDASAIEVLEGLEPVRRRPGMYIGGTDDRALHHLAAEVIDNSMDEGGKFEGKAYSTSGGLHGVGVSVVNALSTETIVEVARDKKLYRQSFAKGIATSPLEEVGAAPNRRGTSTSFTPDPEIFGKDATVSPDRLYKLARSKAYLFAGVEIRWRCDP